MPFFFDLSSLIPTVERNPFEPVIVNDEVPVELPDTEVEAEPIIDTGLPIPSHYDFDMMRALVQDPFRLFVYWQLRTDPYARLRHFLPPETIAGFHTVLKLIDETNRIAVFFDAAYAREYWFSVYPDRTYRVELGLRSPQHGYVRLLSSQSVTTPRGGPSDQMAVEEDFQIDADAYIGVLRDSHLVPERALQFDQTLANGAPAGAFNNIWDALPESFRRLMRVIADIQTGRDFDRWWERLDKEQTAGLVREFLATINNMGQGELGYLLLLRYLPELLRRALLDEAPRSYAPQPLDGPVPEPAPESLPELLIDKPITLYLAEKLGQAASEYNAASSSEQTVRAPGASQPAQSPPGSVSHGQWLPSLTT